MDVTWHCGLLLHLDIPVGHRAGHRAHALPCAVHSYAIRALSLPGLPRCRFTPFASPYLASARACPYHSSFPTGDAAYTRSCATAALAALSSAISPQRLLTLAPACTHALRLPRHATTYQRRVAPPRAHPACFLHNTPAFRALRRAACQLLRARTPGALMQQRCRRAPRPSYCVPFTRVAPPAASRAYHYCSARCQPAFHLTTHYLTALPLRAYLQHTPASGDMDPWVNGSWPDRRKTPGPIRSTCATTPPTVPGLVFALFCACLPSFV